MAALGLGSLGKDMLCHHAARGKGQCGGMGFDIPQPSGLVAGVVLDEEGNSEKKASRYVHLGAAQAPPELEVAAGEEADSEEEATPVARNKFAMLLED